jgi:hypothetical protein
LFEHEAIWAEGTDFRSHVDDLASFKRELRRIRKSADVSSIFRIKEERNFFYLGYDLSVVHREGGVNTGDVVKRIAFFNADYKVMGTDVVEEF